MMEQFEFFIEEKDSGIRIDRVLTEKMEEYSRSYLQKLLKEQQVSVNHKPAKANYKVQTGDSVCVMVPELKEPDITAEEIPLDILYEDDYLLVVNKPKGMVVHPSAGHMEGTLVNAVLAHCE